jgi:uncharacterized protein GlcG (DUF336 family)
MATTMALTAIETCKGQGYNVSAHVLGRNAEVLIRLRGDIASQATFPPANLQTTSKATRTPVRSF